MRGSGRERGCEANVREDDGGQQAQEDRDAHKASASGADRRRSTCGPDGQSEKAGRGFVGDRKQRGRREEYGVRLAEGDPLAWRVDTDQDGSKNAYEKATLQAARGGGSSAGDS